MRVSLLLLLLLQLAAAVGCTLLVEALCVSGRCMIHSELSRSLKTSTYYVAPCSFWFEQDLELRNQSPRITSGSGLGANPGENEFFPLILEIYKYNVFISWEKSGNAKLPV